MRLVPATLRHLEEAASWPGSQEECDFWSGHRVRFPVDMDRVAAEIGFDQAANYALLNGDIVTAFGQVLSRSGDRAHLARIIVNPSLRGAGVGSVLIDEIADAARLSGFAKVSLNVNDGNEPAIRFYRKLGFVPAPRPSDDAIPEACQYMERPF